MNYKKASAFKKKFPGMKHPLLNRNEKRERPKGEIIKKMNKDLEQIIEILRVHTKKQLGFMCES